MLKIDDTYEEPLSDQELLDDEYDEYHNVKSADTLQDNVSTIALSSRLGDLDLNNLASNSRPKSAFKKTFDYEEAVNNEEVATTTTKKEKKHRSKSRKHHRSSSRNRSPLPLQHDLMSETAALADKTSRDRSSSNSRIATGDTGYESISALSLKSLDQLKERFSQHQPKIVSAIPSSSATLTASSSANSTANAALANHFANNSFTIANRPVSVSMSQQFNGKPTLKSLKTNLAPLSAIKLNPK